MTSTHSMMERLTTVVLAMLIACAALRAQDDAPKQPAPYLYVGGIGGYSLMNNNATFLIFTNLPDCGAFNSGTAQDFFGGITVEYPFLEYLDISGRVLYARRPASLTSQYDCGLRAFDPQLQKDVPYLREHVFTANLQYITLDIGARFMPFRFFDMNIPLYLRASVEAGNPIIGNDYSQTEEIIQPGSLLFPDGTKKHTIASGELNGAGTSYSASGAIGFDVRVGKKLFISPEVGYRYGLNSVVKDLEWKTTAYYGAINIRYALAEEIPPPPELPPPPPLVPEPQPVAKKAPEPLIIQAFNTTPLEVQETVVTETYPLLPYVFFDSSSSSLRERYKPPTNPNSFRENQLPKQTLTIYYNLLNVIGARMRALPNSSIKITGTTDGRELPTFAQRKKVAEDRAKEVADYLTTVWNIGPERISIVSDDVPRLSSNPSYLEGLEENRRVEITSSDPAILAPVVHSRFNEYMPMQNKQVFSVRALRPELSRGWDANILRNYSTLAHLSGDSLLPPLIPFALDSTVMVSLGREIAQKDSLNGALSVLQNDGSSVTAGCKFPIIKTQNQFEISRLSLIVFDFDRADITGVNRTMMESFVNEAIHPDSRISITGTTDRLGEMDYNKTLSQSRADAAKALLLELKNDALIDSAVGTGASQLKYDNNLPEGRYYCRTVTIVVQTPVKR